MAEHQRSNELSPVLKAVLSSLNVSLEAELNRYRRTRHTHGAAGRDIENDIFADLDAAIEDASNFGFDLHPARPSPSLFDTAETLPSDTPPPPPPNKRLLAAENIPAASASHLSTDAQPISNSDASSRFGSQPTASSTAPTISALAPRLHSDNRLDENRLGENSSANTPDLLEFKTLSAESADTREILETKATLSFREDVDSGAVIKALPVDSYLASSEKLIESLSDVADMPEPINLNPKPRRKTVSLMAGAALGLLALVAGLGASYVMSNPDIAQTLAGGLNRESASIDPVAQRTFDPPGPDLSAQEFVDLKLDNLSSLDMQQSLDPLSTDAIPATPSLPPIDGAAAMPPSSSAASLPPQALAIPAESNYYVTVPFSTEQGLLEVRQAVEEAFVRQFSDGNRIQLAVFDNLETAQAFIAQLQTQGVQAQLYGPTSE